MESLAGKYYKETQKAINESQIDHHSDSIKFDTISGFLKAQVYSGPAKKDHFGMELDFISGGNCKVFEIPMPESVLAQKPKSTDMSDEEWEKYFDLCIDTKSEIVADLVAKLKNLTDEFDAKVLDLLRQMGFEKAE